MLTITSPMASTIYLKYVAALSEVPRATVVMFVIPRSLKTLATSLITCLLAAITFLTTSGADKSSFSITDI